MNFKLNPVYVRPKSSPLPETARVVGEYCAGGVEMFKIVFLGYSKIESWLKSDCQILTPNAELLTILKQWENTIQIQYFFK